MPPKRVGRFFVEQVGGGGEWRLYDRHQKQFVGRPYPSEAQASAAAAALHRSEPPAEPVESLLRMLSDLSETDAADPLRPFEVVDEVYMEERKREADESSEMEGLPPLKRKRQEEEGDDSSDGILSVVHLLD